MKKLETYQTIQAISRPPASSINISEDFIVFYRTKIL